MYLDCIPGIVFMVLTVAAGWSVLGRLRIGLSTLERLAASTVVGIVAATWVSFAGYLATGKIEIGIGLSALALIIIILMTRPWQVRRPLDKAHLVPVAICLLAAFAFMYLCLLNYYGGVYHIAYPIFGDAAFHSAMVTSFGEGVNYPPSYPMMAGQPLRYTFFIDFFSAMLYKLGLGLQWSIILPGILLLASLLATLYFLATRFTGRRAGGLMAVALIVFSGGLGFAYAINDWWNSGSSLSDFLANANLNYTTMYNLDLVLSNFIDVILTERTALTGFAAGTLIVLLFYKRLAGRKEAEQEELELDDRTLLCFAGVLTGLLPMFHTYTYASIMLAAGIFLVMSGLKKDNGLSQVKQWLWFFVPALLLALPQVAWLLGGGEGSYLRIQIGWMASSLADIPMFWITNLGFDLLLLVIGMAVAGREKLKFYLPFAAIFVLANIVIFQPWDYDNHSFFSFWLLPSAPLMAAALLRVWDIRRIGKPLCAVLLLLAVLTGALVADFMLTRPYEEYSAGSVQVADWISQNTPANAVFLTGDSPNHPVTSLAGRASFLGYTGWMYTHGIDTSARAHAVSEMYNATSPDELYGLMAQYGISYVYIGPEECFSTTYTINTTLFDSMTPAYSWTSPEGYPYRIYKAP